MDSVIKPQLMKSLRALHLPTFASHHATQAALATQDGWTYDRYLLALCEMELGRRETRRKQKLLHESKLPRAKTMASFDRTRLKRTLERQVAALMDGDFLDRAENVLVFGNPDPTTCCTSSPQC